MHLKSFYFFLLAYYSDEISADLATFFDVGGIIGAIVAGVVSDYSGMSALTCASMLAVSCPAVSIYW